MHKPYIIIGLGTGRCGTMTLATHLSMQKGVVVTHEDCRMPWVFDYFKIQYAMGCIFGKIVSDERVKVAGDVASWWLHYVPYINERYPDAVRFVCLQRKKSETVNSFINKVKKANHWTAYDSKYRDDVPSNPFDECYPWFDLPKDKAVNKYWADYYRRAQELEKQFDNFKIFPMECMNTAAGLGEIFSHVGLSGKLTLDTTLKLNESKEAKK